jgi:hypothetical protein
MPFSLVANKATWASVDFIKKTMKIIATQFPLINIIVINMSIE